jgi:hypothetical protein
VLPLTVVPVGPVRLMLTVEDWTDSLKAALTVVVVGTLVAPLAGLWLVTVGGVVSVAVVVNTTSTQ